MWGRICGASPQLCDLGFMGAGVSFFLGLVPRRPHLQVNSPSYSGVCLLGIAVLSKWIQACKAHETVLGIF